MLLLISDIVLPVVVVEKRLIVFECVVIIPDVVSVGMTVGSGIPDVVSVGGTVGSGIPDVVVAVWELVVSAVVAIPDAGPVDKIEVSAVVVIPDVRLVSTLVVSDVVLISDVVSVRKLVVSAVVVIWGVVANVKPVIFCFVVISKIKIVEFLNVMAVNKDMVCTIGDIIT